MTYEQISFRPAESADLLTKVLRQAYPAINPLAAELIAKEVIIAADYAAQSYVMQTFLGAMHGEAMVTIMVTDELLLKHDRIEVEL